MKDNSDYKPKEKGPQVCEPLPGELEAVSLPLLWYLYGLRPLGGGRVYPIKN